MDKTQLYGSDISHDGDIYTIKTPAGEVYIISHKRFEKLSAEYNRREKDKNTARWLCVGLGFFGVHRFYVGDFLKGLLLLCTFGGMFFGWVLDFFFIQARVDEYNRNLLLDLAAQAIEATRKENVAVYDTAKM